MTEINTLSEDTIQRIADYMRRTSQTPVTRPATPRGEEAKSGPRVVRFARTVSVEESYPTADANTYEVELGEPEFVEVAGNQTLTFTPYTPQELRYAHDICDRYIEEGSYVLIELNHGQWYVSEVCTASEVLTPFCTTARVNSLDGFPVDAKKIDCNGSEYGETIQVTTPPVIESKFGPAAKGFKGWATEIPTGSCGSQLYVVNMQTFAKAIKFSGADFTGGGCTKDYNGGSGFSVDEYWDGEDPTQDDGETPAWNPRLSVDFTDDCACLGDNVKGIAIFDMENSTAPTLLYRVVAADQMPFTAKIVACSTDCGDITGIESTRTLVFDDGDFDLKALSGGCSSIACGRGIQWAGVGVDGTGISSGGRYKTIAFSDEFLLSNSGSDCTSQVQVDIDFYMSIDSGTCIDVEDNGDGSVTINNTMTVVGESPIVVTQSGCDYTVKLQPDTTTPPLQVDRYVCGCDEANGTFLYTTVTYKNGIVVGRESECDYSGGSGSGTTGGNDFAVTGIDCDDPNGQDRFYFELLNIPSGASYFQAVVVGDQGSGGTIGPESSYTTGITYAGALNTGWAPAAAGECFTVTFTWYDSGDNPIGTSTVWSGCCE